MEQRQFLEAITVICQFFGSPWPKESVSTAYDQVKDLSIEAMKAAHKRIYVDFPPRPIPAIGRIVTVIKEEAIKINLASSPSEPLSRRENDKQFASRFGERVSEHEKLAMDLCLKIASGKLVEWIIEAMGHMEAKFPGVGWKEEQIYWIQKKRLEECQ